MVLTNSFGGSKFMLRKYGYPDKVREFNELPRSSLAERRHKASMWLARSGRPASFLNHSAR